MSDEDTKEFLDLEYTINSIFIDIEKESSSDEELSVLKREDDKTYTSPRTSRSRTPKVEHCSERDPSPDLVPEEHPDIAATTDTFRLDEQETKRQETDRRASDHRATDPRDTTDRKDTDRRVTERRETERQEANHWVTDHREIDHRETDHREADLWVTDHRETGRRETDRQEADCWVTDHRESDRREADRRATYRRVTDRRVTDRRVTDRWATGRQQTDRRQHVIMRCGMCGYIMHTRAYQECPARRRRCDHCNRMGHYRAFCWSEPRLPRLRDAFQFENPAMRRPRPMRLRNCDSCGYRVHTRADRQCPALLERCFRCHRYGHFKSVCSPQLRRRRHFPPLDAQSKRRLVAAVRLLLE